MDNRELVDGYMRAFWQRVDKTADCWLWSGSYYLSHGKQRYGTFRGKRVHRIAYELLVGPIPPRLVIDHTCRNTLCVRPDHLEPVTNKINILRGNSFSAINSSKTHCPRGHEYSSENTRIRPHGYRGCRACLTEQNKRAEIKRSAKRAALSAKGSS
jgi:hypothetical protein